MPDIHSILYKLTYHAALQTGFSTLVLQGTSQALQERVATLETASQRQDKQVEKLQAGAKRHMESSLRQSTARRSLQQASQKEDKLQQQIGRLETELAASRRCDPLLCSQPVL